MLLAIKLLDIQFKFKTKDTLEMHSTSIYVSYVIHGPELFSMNQWLRNYQNIL